MRRDNRVTALTSVASRQHGVFTRAQALSAGFTRSAVDHRLRVGTWEPVDYGVYRVAGTPGSWHQRLIAACLGGPAVASHRAAAALWRFPGFGAALPEVSAVRYRRRHAGDILWHESVHLAPIDITEIDGIEVTTPTRTILDLGAVCDIAQLLHAYDDAVRRRLADWSTVARRLEHLGPVRRGSGTVREVLRRRHSTALPESPLETTFDAFADEHRLPASEVQHWVTLLNGTRVRIDRAYPAARLAIEVDSVEFHAGPDEWQRDVARQNELAALGWRTLRFSADDLASRPDWVARLVLAALSAVNLPGDVQVRNKGA
jgi:very-short-patch-repair endonuclease